MLLAALALACGGEDDQPVVDISPVPSPTASPAPSPTASPLPLPEKPSSFEEFPTTIADYLTQVGGSSDCLAELFGAWEMPSDDTTSCVAADMDGDGEDEYVVRVVREALPEEGGLEGWLSGTIVVLDDSGAGYEVVFGLADVDELEGDYLQPAIFDVSDSNGDGLADALCTTSVCGAHTCSLTVYRIGYLAGEYVSILDAGDGMDGTVTFPFADDQIRLEDVDGDGVAELLLREGLIGSVGAGPQREATHTYRWDGELYSLASVEYDASDLRYFKVRDADDAFAEGDYRMAMTLYREAAESSTLQDEEYFGNPAELRAYARFRMALVKAVQGDGNGALSALDTAIAADPDALHSEMAAQFRLGYKKVRHVSAGCAAARDFIAKHLDAFTTLWDYGYANPAFQPEALCPS